MLLILLRQVNAYLSQQSCAGPYCLDEGLAFIGNPGPSDQKHSSSSINRYPEVTSEMANGFVLHKVGRLEIWRSMTLMKSNVVDSAAASAKWHIVIGSDLLTSCEGNEKKVVKFFEPLCNIFIAYGVESYFFKSTGNVVVKSTIHQQRRSRVNYKN